MHGAWRQSEQKALTSLYRDKGKIRQNMPWITLAANYKCNPELWTHRCTLRPKGNKGNLTHKLSSYLRTLLKYALPIYIVLDEMNQWQQIISALLAMLHWTSGEWWRTGNSRDSYLLSGDDNQGAMSPLGHPTAQDSTPSYSIAERDRERERQEQAIRRLGGMAQRQLRVFVAGERTRLCCWSRGWLITPVTSSTPSAISPVTETEPLSSPVFSLFIKGPLSTVTASLIRHASRKFAFEMRVKKLAHILGLVMMHFSWFMLGTMGVVDSIGRDLWFRWGVMFKKKRFLRNAMEK